MILNIIRSRTFGAVLASFFAVGGLCAATKYPVAVNILTEGVPCDTLFVVSPMHMAIFDEISIDESNIDLIVKERESVEMRLSSPDDSTVKVVMKMAVSDVVPVPSSGVPDIVAVEFINPSIVSDGQSGRSMIEVDDVYISSTKAVADSLSVDGMEAVPAQ